jgi:bacillithiol system protein YtxJ
MSWQQINDPDQFTNDILDNDQIHLVFKHSPRCGISKMVLRRFENFDFYQTSEIQFWLLDVLNSRHISNSIAAQFNIRHESPQILVIKNRKLLHHSSHSAIEAEEINNIISNWQ